MRSLRRSCAARSRKWIRNTPSRNGNRRTSRLSRRIVGADNAKRDDALYRLVRADTERLQRRALHIEQITGCWHRRVRHEDGDEVFVADVGNDFDGVLVGNE